MFDASAWELAQLDSSPSGSAVTGPDDGRDPVEIAGPAAIAVAACHACQRAIGACAIDSARAGALSPALAVAVCNSFQRMMERAFEARDMTAPAYFAFVLLGRGCSAVSRHADLTQLVETMR
jgi:hypothetical protein